MKSIMLSVRPQWVEKIVNGEKTIEVRKSRPMIETPFKCYIYMTQGKLKELGDYSQWIYENRMKVIGEFVCDRIDEYTLAYGFSEKENKDGRYGNIKDYCYFQHNLLLDEMCLTEEEFNNYGKGEPLYGWHISNLKIYDKPRMLSEFKKYSDCEFTNECVNCFEYSEILKSCSIDLHLTRPPQSWQFVEIGE